MLSHPVSDASYVSYITCWSVAVAMIRVSVLNHLWLVYVNILEVVEATLWKPNIGSTLTKQK